MVVSCRLLHVNDQDRRRHRVVVSCILLHANDQAIGRIIMSSTMLIYIIAQATINVVLARICLLNTRSICSILAMIKALNMDMEARDA